MLRETLALTAVQSAVLFLALWGIFRLAPSIPANAKAWLWRLAFLKPLLSLLPFAVVSLPFLPAEKPAPVETVYAYEVPLAPGPAMAQTAPEPPNLPAPTHSHPDYLLWAWALGVVSVAIYGAVGMRRAWRVADGARLVQDEDLLRAYADLLRAAKVRRWPRLLQSETVPSAMLIGGRRSAIVLPAGTTLDDLRMMMAHELAHVVRRDLFWFSLASAVQSLFFFNPMVWVAARCSRLDHESATDRHASHLAGVPIQTYADMLLRATVVARPSLAPGSLPVAESYRTIHRRLEAMKHFNSKPTFLRRTATAALAILTLTMLPAYQLCAAAWQKDKVAPTQPPVAHPKDASNFAIYEYDQKKKKYYKITLSPSNKKIKLKNGHIIYAKSAPKGGFYVIWSGKDGKKEHIVYTVSKREELAGNPIYRTKPTVEPKAPVAPAPPVEAKAPTAPAPPAKGVKGVILAPAAPTTPPKDIKGAPMPPTTIAPPVNGAPPAIPPTATVQPTVVTTEGIQVKTAGTIFTKPQIVTTNGVTYVVSNDQPKSVVFVDGKAITQGRVTVNQPAVVYTTKGATTFVPSQAAKLQTVTSKPLQYRVAYGTTLNTAQTVTQKPMKYEVVYGTTLNTTQKPARVVYSKPLDNKYQIETVYKIAYVKGKAPLYIYTKDGVYKLVKPNGSKTIKIVKGGAEPKPTTNDQGVSDPKPIGH